MAQNITNEKATSLHHEYWKHECVRCYADGTVSGILFGRTEQWYVAGIVICFLAFDMPQFSGDRLTAVAALLGLFGLASLPLTYVLHFFFVVRADCSPHPCCHSLPALLQPQL